MPGHWRREPIVVSQEIEHVPTMCGACQAVLVPLHSDYDCLAIDLEPLAQVGVADRNRSKPLCSGTRGRTEGTAGQRPQRPRAQLWEHGSSAQSGFDLECAEYTCLTSLRRSAANHGIGRKSPARLNSRNSCSSFVRLCVPEGHFVSSGHQAAHLFWCTGAGEARPRSLALPKYLRHQG